MLDFDDMDENNFPQPERVLVVLAHPDDPEFGAGGLVGLWAKMGAEVTYAIVTDGSKGSSEPEMTAEELVEIRNAEQCEAAKILGVSEVLFLGFEDGRVTNTTQLREQIVRLIRRYRPDVLITHDPTTRIFEDRYFNHTDHRAVGDTTLDAVFPLARDRLNFPEHEAEGLESHKVLEVFLTSSNSANYLVDISATIDAKLVAIKAHRSQIGDPEALESRMRQRHRSLAREVSFEYGEQFRRVRLPG